MTYEEAIRYIEEIPRFSETATLADTRRTLAELGNPDRRIGPVIHVAGTNGKGSVCAFLASVLQEAGLKTALFTSPHLIRMNERISIGGEPISDADFLRIFLRVKEAVMKRVNEGRPHPLYFEFLFLMAMVYFAEEGTEAAVIETGLGGRLDATNCIERPALTVITEIGLDHVQILGGTISEIAAEKAGIMKEGVPCAAAGDRREAASVIRGRAKACGAPLRFLTSRDVMIKEAADGEIDFSTAFRYDGHADFRIRASAPYQAENAALALLALLLAKEHGVFPRGKTPDAEAVRSGLMKMYWPARMEQIAPRVFLDGAHNADGVRRFVEAAAQIARGGDAHLLFAVASDKDYREMISLILAPHIFRSIIVTEIGGSRRTSSADLAGLMREAGMPCVTDLPSFQEAYREILKRQGAGYVFICGSLYLAGYIKELRKADD